VTTNRTTACKTEALKGVQLQQRWHQMMSGICAYRIFFDAQDTALLRGQLEARGGAA
jgi:hypothetical protein